MPRKSEIYPHATAEILVAQAKEAGLFVLEPAEWLELLMPLDFDAKVPADFYLASQILINTWLADRN